MQDVVPMDLARQLTGNFYRRLLEHGFVDRALNEARLLLFDKKQVNWAIPVLFMRLRTGQLFAADPVLMALQAIHADPNGYDRDKENLPLPMEVRHLVGNIDPGDLQRLGQEFGPSLDVVEATLTIFSKRGPREPAGHDQPGAFVLLIGGHGTAKSTELRHIASITAEQSLRPNAEQQVIPVFVNLRDYLKLRAGSRNSIETLILDSIRPFWPDLTANELSTCFSAMRVLFLGYSLTAVMISPTSRVGMLGTMSRHLLTPFPATNTCWLSVSTTTIREG